MRRRLWPADVPPPIRLLAGTALVNTLGAGLMGPLITLYIHDDLHRSLGEAGLVVMLQALASIAGQLVGGLLHDRYGGKAPLAGSLVAAALICGALAVATAWWPYVALMMGFGFAQGTARAPLNALTDAFWPGAGRRAFNVQYIARNVGFASGAAVGGFLAQRAFALAFAAAGAAFLGSAVAVAVALPPAPRETVLGRPLPPAEPLPRAERRRLLVPVAALAGGVLLAQAVYSQWPTTVAVYMVARKLPLSAYGLLWTLNGASVIAMQPLANAMLRRIGPRLDRQLMVAAALYVCAFGALLLPPRLPVFVASMLLLSAGEMFDRPAWPAAIAALAPPGRAGAFQGLLGAALGGGRMVGPLGGGLVYDAWPPQVLWWACCAGAGFAAAAYRAYGVRAETAAVAGPGTAAREEH